MYQRSDSTEAGVKSHIPRTGLHRTWKGRGQRNFSSILIGWTVYDFLMASRTEAYPRVLYLIAAFKLVKGFVLFAVGIGALKLLDRQSAAAVYQWANAFSAAPPPHKKITQLPLIRSLSF